MTDGAWTIRPAAPEDADALRRLAELDSARPLCGRVLLAESHGVPLAAVSLHTGLAIADPFRPSADAVRMLRHLRYQLTRQGARRPLPPPLRRTHARACGRA